MAEVTQEDIIEVFGSVGKDYADKTTETYRQGLRRQDDGDVYPTGDVEEHYLGALWHREVGVRRLRRSAQCGSPEGGSQEAARHSCQPRSRLQEP